MKSWMQATLLAGVEASIRWILYGFLDFVESSPTSFRGCSLRGGMSLAGVWGNLFRMAVSRMDRFAPRNGFSAAAARSSR
jgi:hypothetical protein